METLAPFKGDHKPNKPLINKRLSRHILTYSHWYEQSTIEKAKADLRDSI
ncbi:hypothetical protein ABC345_16400 [Shouchella sp. 1P09AA]